MSLPLSPRLARTACSIVVIFFNEARADPFVESPEAARVAARSIIFSAAAGSKRGFRMYLPQWSRLIGYTYLEIFLSASISQKKE
jgi:hypothetical protein